MASRDVHRRRPWALAAALAVTTLVATCSSVAEAEEAPAGDSSTVALAERRAADAFHAYERKDYPTAVALYLQAYDAAPSGSILYNVARIYDIKLADRPLAITFYLRFLAEPGAQTHLVEEATQRLRALRQAELATSRIKAESANRGEGERAAWGHGDAPAAARDRPQSRPDGWSAARWIGVALAGAGVAGIGVGSAFGWAAMSRNHTAHDLCDGNACTSQQGVDAARAARTDATLSTLGFAAGGGLLVAGAALFFWGGERASEPDARTGLHLEASATPADLSLHLWGRW